MLKKIGSFLFSTRLTAVLFLVFAAAMAIGTFLDASSQNPPTPYTRELIYNAWWFEAIMAIFLINFLGNIKRYGLHKRELWASLMLHLSLALVIVGAFVTRYIGYEGVMHIREGDTSNVLISEDAYLNAFIDGDFMVDGIAQRRRVKPKKLRMSEKLNNKFTVKTDYNGQEVLISYVDFIEGAEETLLPDESGEEYVKIVESGDGQRHEHWVKIGSVQNIHNILFAINKPTDGAINITWNEDGNHLIETPFEGSFMQMSDQSQGEVLTDSVQPFHMRSLYSLGVTSFVVPDPAVRGVYGIAKAENPEGASDALILNVSSKGESQEVTLMGGRGYSPNPTEVPIAGLNVYLSFGSKQIELPFSVTLNEFIADKYPGTEKAYASFKSRVTVINEDQSHFDTEIFMNNVLDHQGYRFFQSGFDPDEGGTILSVNHDRAGTWITYIGYTFLYIGLLGIFFGKNTRFGKLGVMLRRLKEKKKRMMTVLVLLLSIGSFAQSHSGNETLSREVLDSMIVANAVSKEHADKFAHLIIQDYGRMKPVNTFSSELLRKISRKDHYLGLNADQVFLSMVEFPRLWVEVPLIALKRGNDSIRHVAGIPESQNSISLMDLFDEKGGYKLGPYLTAATQTTNPNQYQKDFIKAHENFSLLNSALSGSILKIFPIPDDPNNKWISALELGETENIKGMDSVYVRNILPLYFDSLRQARETGDYSQAEDFLESIGNFQKKYGEEILPSKNKLRGETIYNRVDVFNRLYQYMALLGVFMFVVIIAQLFKDRKILRGLVLASKALMWIFFVAMTLGLILRWYVSGHAPMSDAYESVIYVAWATVLFGLIFGRKSDLTVAATAFVGAIILWVAHQNWIDPSIANLEPVLDSYWLMIHVSVIVMSYGPFTLGMMLAATSLFLMIFTNKNNYKRMELNISELTIITEMALIVGLVLLTIGNFLGGQWANESWGRYWGWDPKETWALISIMIYAFVIHARLVPGLRGRWTFNVFAMFAYASIMMTYFGVNFYLSGLHSYASGDAPATPTFVYWITVAAVILSVLAYFQHKKYYKKKKRTTPKRA